MKLIPGTRARRESCTRSETSCSLRISLLPSAPTPACRACDNGMERFSWSDNLRAALAPCLACFHTRQDNDDEEQGQYNHHHATSNRGPDYVPRARADELEGLLADSDDAETLSLHSNIGRDDNRRRKRRRPRKGIRLFGFDLFGKPPIHLPEDDEVDARRARSRTISASTLDSDAAPLDPSMIDQLSATRLAEGEAQREAERLAKEERRRRRKEKKAARQAALALALEGNQDEFEGFPVRSFSFMSVLLSLTTSFREAVHHMRHLQMRPPLLPTTTRSLVRSSAGTRRTPSRARTPRLTAPPTLVLKRTPNDHLVKAAQMAPAQIPSPAPPLPVPEPAPSSSTTTTSAKHRWTRIYPLRPPVRRAGSTRLGTRYPQHPSPTLSCLLPRTSRRSLPLCRTTGHLSLRSPLWLTRNRSSQ